MKIAVDVTGGDQAYEAPVKAALKFAKDYPNIELILLTDQEDKLPELPENISVQQVSQVINMCDEPAKSIREKKDSAIVKGAQAVHDKEVDAFISAGSTGALVSAGVLKVKRLKGVERPAFPIFLQKDNGEYRMYLDMGASIDAKPSWLLTHAHLATIYYQIFFGKENPTVALINNGSESSKGDNLYLQTHQLLAEAKDLNFVGNIEGYDLLTTNTDIIVMDGFVGNIVLKTLEGSINYFSKELKQSLFSSFKSKIGALLIKKNLKAFKKKLDPNKIGCAPILGIDGLVLKVHGSANTDTFYNGLVNTKKMVDEKMIARLKENELLTNL